MPPLKPISRILYVFDDHIKSSNDFFRQLLGKYHDFDGNQLTKQSIKAAPLATNADFVFEKPFLVDEDKSIFIQTISFSPKDTLKNDSTLDGDESGRGMGVIATTPENDFGLDVDIGSSDDPFADRGLLRRPENRPTPPGNRPSRNEESSRTIRQKLTDFLGNSSKKFRDINFKTDRLVEYDNELNLKYFKIDSFYNYYIQSYERMFGIVGGVIPEEALPNFYVFSLIKDKSILGTIQQSDFDSTGTEQSNSAYDDIYKRFDTLINLDGNLSLGGNPIDTNDEAISVLSYYKAYAESYDSVSADLAATLKGRFGVLVNYISYI